MRISALQDHRNTQHLLIARTECLGASVSQACCDRRQAAQLKTAEKRSTAEGVHKAGGGPSVCSFPRPLRGALAESSNPHSAEGQRTRPAAAPAATVATAAALKSSQNEQSGRPTIPRPKASTLPARSESALVKPFMEKGADAESKQHYRIAATIYEQVSARRSF